MGGNRHEELLGELRRLAERLLAGSGLELVDLGLRGSTRRRVLRLDIDRAGPQGIDLEDCKRVNDLIGKALEEDDPIQGGYVLEVSSAGIDRPLVTDDDIRRNIGRRIVVTTTEPIDGQREFRGVLVGRLENALQLSEEGSEAVLVPRDKIEKARQDVSF